MKRGSAVLVLGGLVIALVAAALFVVLSPGADDGDTADDTADVSTAPEADGPAADAAHRRDRVAGAGAILGVVVHGADRKPVTGQAVSLAGVEEQPLEVVTDASGAFRFERLPAGGPYDLTVAADGCATVRLPGLALSRDEQRDVGTLVLDAAVRVVVQVRSWSDEPIGGTCVSAYAAVESGSDYDWTKAMAQIAQTPVAVQTVTAGADGDAVFPELAVGRWTFVAEKPGYARSGRGGIRLRREDARPDPVTLRLAPGGALTGRVLDASGGALAGALVIAGRAEDAWDPQSAPLAARSRSAEDGKYALTALPAGPVIVRVARKDALPATVATVRIPDVTQIDLVVRDGGTVTGRVTVQEDGAPVAGAVVNVSSWSTGSAGSVSGETDEEGRYTVTGVPAGNLGTITVEADGWAQAPAGFEQAMVEPGGVLERDVEVVPAARVSGTVRGPGGPVAGAKVSVLGGDLQFGITSKLAVSGPDGRFAIEGLTPGAYVVQAAAAGLHQVEPPDNPWTELQSGAAGRWSFRIKAGETREIDVELHLGVSVIGQVIDASGDELTGVQVGIATDEMFAPSGVAAPTAKTGADGVFRLTGVRRAAAVRLTATLAAHVPDGDATEIDTRSGEDHADVILRLRRAPVVAGHVVGPDGAPVPHASVQVVWEATPDADQGFMIMQGGDADPFSGETQHPVGADGSYEVPLPWRGGRFRVRARAPGHAPRTSEQVPLAAGRDRYELDLQMESGAVIRGHVVAKETGDALAGAHVTLTRVPDSQRGGVLIIPGDDGDDGAPIVAVTGADGAFAVERLEGASYRVAARMPGRVREQETTRAPADDLVLALAAALTIEGVVVDAAGEGVAGLTVTAQGADGADAVEAITFFGGDAPGTAQTDAQGRFTLRDLAAGTYTLAVSAEWGAPVSIQPFTSPPFPAGARDVRLTVQSGLEISGRVLDEDGQPVGGAMLMLQGGQEWRNAQSKPDGSFLFGGLPSDGTEYQLQTQTQSWTGRSLRPAVRKVRAGETSLEIRLLPGLTIEGRVRREDGAALPDGASVNAEPVDSEDHSLWFGWNQSEIDTDGAFRVAGLGEGTYRLRLDAEDDGRALVLRGDGKVESGTTGLDLVAWFGARISGRVRVDGGASLEGATVRAVPSEGGNVTATPVQADGSFEITGLTEGIEYDVSSHAAGRLGQEVKAVAGQVAAVELSLRAGARASGRILAADGEPLAAAQLWVSGPGVSDSMGRQTDADGRFELEGLEPEGEYAISVLVRSAGGFDVRQVGEIRAGQQDAVLRLLRPDEE